MSLLELQIYHKTPYPAIDPRRPELSQAGRTILITGGNGGIGFAIARAFIIAGAKRVIILGRGPEKVKSAAIRLTEELRVIGSPTIVDGRVCNASDIDSTDALWADFQRDGIAVDVVVMNAASFGEAKPLLEAGRDRVWQDFNTNVRSHLDFAERLQKQKGEGALGRKYLVNVSSTAIYMWSTTTPELPSYGLTKNAGTALLQQIAKDVNPYDLQITIVWAASPEAEFLHGRFVWANWDVEEVKDGVIGKRIREDPHFLKVGVEGLSESMAPPQI
ncbi:hypothetical protein Daus18300_010355 [Diaporthe australafricana]|uniref:Uncharacterized protein n=1 Tax=Diaporthe australafricana TaxID=127596 RepID=A0ABR3WBG0_9PEZI